MKSSRPGRALCLLTASAIALGACSETPRPSSTLPPAPLIPAQTGAQRLTVAQYRNAVHDVFGEAIAVPTALEPDTSLEGFDAIGASISAVSPRGVEQYEDAAFKIADQVLASTQGRAAVVPCTPKGTSDKECASAFVTALGRKLWRRALTQDEIATIAQITVDSATTLGDFYEGVSFGMAALLQSPNFLYRAAVGEPDPEHPGKLRYTSAEMASRLSFFLWNGPPDDELLDAAEAGELTDFLGLVKQTQRLLDSPRARRGLRSFVTDWLRLDQLDDLSKDPTIFTYYSPEVGPAAREETLLDFEHLAFDLDGDYRDLFTQSRTFVNPKLASMYQVLAPDPDGFAEVELPADIPRRGLLGHVSVLALYAHPTSSSATLRGKFVRTQLLCGKILPPPVDVNTALPEPSGTTRTLRERVNEHLTDPFCASCHNNMDPIGLGLENFDGIGRYRIEDNGEVIDASGDLDKVGFVDAVSLGVAVRNHPDLAGCFVSKMYEYATSFKETPQEKKSIEYITEEFVSSGHKIKALMLHTVMSPGFRLASEVE